MNPSSNEDLFGRELNSRLLTNRPLCWLLVFSDSCAMSVSEAVMDNWFFRWRRQYQEFKMSLGFEGSDWSDGTKYLFAFRRWDLCWSLKISPKDKQFCLFYIRNFAYFNLFFFIKLREKKLKKFNKFKYYYYFSINFTFLY